MIDNPFREVDVNNFACETYKTLIGCLLVVAHIGLNKPTENIKKYLFGFDSPNSTFELAKKTINCCVYVKSTVYINRT